MKNKIFKILTLSVILLLSVCFMVACNQGNNSDEGIGDSNVQQNATADKYFTFTLLDDGTYSIRAKDIADMPANVVIPSTYNGKAVTSISDSAFRGCSSLTSVVIPDGVTSIGAEAFYNCSSLTSVVIPDGVTSISDSAFRGCSSLTSVYYKSSVVDWQKITIDSLNTNFTSATRYYYSEKAPTVNSVGTAYDGNYWHYDKNGEIVIWDYNATPYKYFTFTLLSNDTYSLKAKDVNNIPAEVVLPSTYNGKAVTSIGELAFAYCSSLKSIVIPDSVTSIGDRAFYDCSRLTSVVIGDGITTIGRNAFYFCRSLTSVVIGDSVTEIGDYAFYYCSSLASVVIPDSVTEIGSYAFSKCSSLTSIKYRGTQTQWNLITRGTGWDSNTGNYTITCNYTGE